MAKKKRRQSDGEISGEPPTNRKLPDIIGPRLPPMIAWQRAGAPGWPFHRPEWLPPISTDGFFD